MGCKVNSEIKDAGRCSESDAPPDLRDLLEDLIRGYGEVRSDEVKVGTTLALPN
jgi:hypothetical protein